MERSRRWNLLMPETINRSAVYPTANERRSDIPMQPTSRYKNLTYATTKFIENTRLTPLRIDITFLMLCFRGRTKTFLKSRYTLRTSSWNSLRHPQTICTFVDGSILLMRCQRTLSCPCWHWGEDILKSVQITKEGTGGCERYCCDC